MAEKKQPVFSIAEHDGEFTIFRDGEPLKTPRTLPVTVPTRALADAVVAEAVGQGEKLDLRKMPMTQMTLTAIDISGHHRMEVVDGIVRFGESELLCQRASDPADLVAAQNEGWQPYLDWAQQKFGITLRTGSGIIPFEQNPEALARLREFVETFDKFRLTGISEAVGTSGSLILGLALATGHADPDAVLAASELDQLWQAKKWGSDPATEGRMAGIKHDLEMIARWFALLG
jgi:chaperone required for assembly of F1-ATPase